jgi:hypothetical protein
MKYSNTRMFIEYILIAFGIYLIFSLVIAFIGNYNYREILCDSNQFYALFLIYWWTPIFRMIDMEKENKQ